MKRLTDIPSLDDIEAAHEAIKPYIHRTPVLNNKSIDDIVGARVYFKCENFQKVGAFKIRGASCAILALDEAERAKGVATHSSGNHAQALALSAKTHGISSYIIMPNNAPLSKKNATLDYGANVIFCEATNESRQATLAKVVEETGAIYIPSFDHYNIIAGQATAAKELIEELINLDVIMAPIGGGGLMSGTALATHYLLPDARIIGAEPKAVDDAFRSFTTKRRATNTTTNSIADGLLTNIGDKTFEIITKYLDDIITVSESEIIAAMRLIWERMKIIVEPSSAVPFAAILQQKERFEGMEIGVILTGGNVDVNNLPF
ncbi:threonine ammonia-lyase [Aureispira anguillae]|uniref:Pyridoxal-phosphate dependent enzyme n=1 Tax=Aureispira anguillae TaxID=2864201 RepID=A0A915YB66_9BACT|nr:pyridoxal-phosphate dependent enzyme [Aureispira anguillae]BDS09838.1 pyridoxal-phosphate dependent enzyme [Aureispira anguillae]